MKVDINAPIIPLEGLGGIKLYSILEELKDILSSECIEYDKNYGSIHCTLINLFIPESELENFEEGNW